MKQLTQQELDAKIAHFLEDRFSKHPELAQVSDSHAGKISSEVVVSRVKSISQRFSSQVKNQAQYQL